MGSLFTYGVTTIKVGDVANDGSMGTTLAALGKTLEGSCKLVQDDPSTTEFRSEESDTPELQIETAGNIVLSFTVMDPDADTLAAIFGGSATGTPKVWSPADQYTSKEQSIEVTPREGMVLKIVRAKMVGKINAEYSKKNIFAVDIKATILTPSASVSAYTFTNPE